MDSGSTDNVFPEQLIGNLTSFRESNLNKVHIGDDSTLNTIGYGNYGILRGVILCVGLIYPLVSVNYLTKILGYHIFFSHNRAYILEIHPKTKDSDHTHFRIVTTATINRATGLFQLDNPQDFLTERRRKLSASDPSKLVNPSPISLPNLVPTNPLISKSKSGQLVASTPSQSIPKEPRPKLTHAQTISGSSKSNPKSSRGAFSILQWLHIRLGHASREAILSMVRNGSIIGSGTSIEELEKDKSWIHCDACQHGRMHSFPVPSSITLREFDIFQFITSDYIPFLKPSIRGYTGSYLFGDKASGKLWSYLVKSKTVWLECYKLLQAEYGPNMNERSKKTIVFMTDFDSVVHETDFTAYILDAGTRLFNSTPHKHAQNLIERFIQTLKNMVRTNMHYNKAPGSYWCYALQYSIDTYNMLCAKGSLTSRNEAFSSEKTDISKCVPFYASGWSYINESERKQLNNNPSFKRNDRALDVRMLGYTDPFRIEDRTKALCYVKNAYVVESNLYTEDILRHDCHFQVLPDSDHYLFHPNPNQRLPTEDSKEDERIERELQSEYDSYLDIVRETDINYPPSAVTNGESVLYPFDDTSQYWPNEDPEEISDHPHSALFAFRPIYDE